MADDELQELVKQNIQDVLRNFQDFVSAPATSGYPSDISAEVPAVGIRGPSVAGEAQPQPQSSAAGDAMGVHMLEVSGNQEATIRLLKARIKSLEEQLAQAIALSHEKDKEAAAQQKDLTQLQQQKATWAKSQKALELQCEKYKKSAEQAKEALSAKEQQLKETSKDSIKVEKDRKASEQETRVREVRLQRALEELDRYKQLLQEVKAQERDGKDVVKADYNKILADNKRLERQKAELLLVFKKQLKLIDVLKKQKVHLEAAKLLSFTEDEFMRALDGGC
eukprot:jgi/Chrzof1/9804/Cz04g16080.t1